MTYFNYNEAQLRTRALELAIAASARKSLNTAEVTALAAKFFAFIHDGTAPEKAVPDDQRPQPLRGVSFTTLNNPNTAVIEEIRALREFLKTALGIPS